MRDDPLAPAPPGGTCWNCLGPFEEGEAVVTCTTQEDGVIHGVAYPKGTTLRAHERCLAPAAEEPFDVGVCIPCHMDEHHDCARNIGHRCACTH